MYIIFSFYFNGPNVTKFRWSDPEYVPKTRQKFKIIWFRVTDFVSHGNDTEPNPSFGPAKSPQENQGDVKEFKRRGRENIKLDQENIERQNAKNTGTILQATICKIDIIPRP